MSWCLVGMPAATVAGAPALTLFSQQHPISFFFRATEAAAATQRLTYEEWARRYERLDGVMGKMLDEEILGRRAAQPYYRRFKREHPDQAVFLHANAGFRNPLADNQFLHPGHWLYYNGSRVTDVVPASGDEITLHVEDTRPFNLHPYGANASIPDDVGLCAWGDDGRPDWNRAEQTKLLGIDRVAKTITLRRGLYGSTHQEFAAGKAYVAAHVAQTWGTVNKLWELNLATTCPRDASHHTAGEVWADEIIRVMRPGGELDFIDGVEFDVPFRQPMALGGTRRADCDADGQPDNGVVGGVPVFAVGVDQYFHRLRQGMPSRLILADVGDRAQRSVETLNGVETEGWPHLKDPEFHSWSTALNDHNFWETRARSPVFTYGLIKYLDQGEIPFSTVRLALAGPLLTGSAVPSTYDPPTGSNGVWDELLGGALQQKSWLGRAIHPPRHLLAEKEKLSVQAPPAQAAEVLAQISAETITAQARDTRAEKFYLRLGQLQLDKGKDLVVTLTLQASGLPGYPSDSYRLVGLTAVSAGDELPLKDKSATSPANEKEFNATFYLPDVAAGKVDLVATVEGGAAVVARNVAVYAGPDVMVAEFEHGIVLANPSHAPFTFDLAQIFPGQHWQRLQATAAQDSATNTGKIVDDSVTVGARDGLFLRRL